MGEPSRGLRVAIDATPAMKSEPSGVAHYIRHLVGAIAEVADPSDHFSLCYRLSRWERRAHRLPLPRPGTRARRTALRRSGSTPDTDSGTMPQP